MSGTSLDGLDMALCRFTKREDATWHYDILKCATADLGDELRRRLAAADTLSGLDLMLLDRDFAAFSARQVNRFLDGTGIRPDFIASHGQTVFHQPDKGLTVQIGSGAAIAALTGITTVCDFRTTDVALGGQGAPLVPIGDKLLFGSYEACLNLGGFSNISFDVNGVRKAFDISPCNMLLNRLAQKMELPFDKDGMNARDGYIYRPLLDQLNRLTFYQEEGAKSLGKEWFDAEVWPLFEQSELCVTDQLRTAVEHITTQITNILNHHKIKSVLVSGGGAKNLFLMDRIRLFAPDTMVVIPQENVVDFKEAILFAFLGLLRLNGEANCLASVTGAAADCCGGAVYC
jgi:anhydro-N-acetylmuramic acid kinase